MCSVATSGSGWPSYAVIRAKARIDDALITLGLPLIQEVLSVADENPITVTSAYSGGDSGFEQWSLILSFPSGVRASIDIASGLGAAQVRALDLRVEWSGAEQAILVDPTAVAVTVITGTGQRQLSAKSPPWLMHCSNLLNTRSRLPRILNGNGWRRQR